MLSFLRVSQIRNLTAVEAHLSQINVVHGRNGAGKTSFLEAVSFLGSGRSFRTNRLDAVIQHGRDCASVFGYIKDLGTGGENVPIGVERYRDGRINAKIAGDRIVAAAKLAERLPTLVINAGSFHLLEGGPSRRRRFMDWGVFHMEPRFHVDWQVVQRSLKQRNSLLRHGRINASVLAAWNERFVLAAETLDSMRQAWFEQFRSATEAALNELSAPFRVALNYQRGWPKDTGLPEALKRSLDTDCKRGFTGPGPQRADIEIRVGGHAAAEVLSRGQQKLMVMALHIAQGAVLGAQANRRAVYLIDDLPAELDARYRLRLCEALVQDRSQVLMTCVDPTELAGCWQAQLPGPPSLFHVEQGAIVQETG